VTAPAKPGVYVLDFDSRTDDSQWLAVNPPPAESELKYIDPRQVTKSILQSGKPQENTPQPTQRELTRGQILQQRLWWVMLLACLAALVGENALLILRSSRIAQ
jgi:hypothetical protein